MYTVKFNTIFDSLGIHRNVEQKDIMRGCGVCMILVLTEIIFVLVVATVLCFGFTMRILLIAQ